MRSYHFAAVAAATAGAVLATPAFAQTERAPFTGLHVEGLVGYDSLSGGNDGSDSSADGFQYGVEAGYDFQVGRFIAGVEGEVGDSTTKLRARDVDLPGDSLSLETGRDLYIGGRLGYAVAPATLLFVKGGYTNARIDAAYNDGAGTAYQDGVTLDGYRVGVGVEQKFNLLGPSGFLRAEYRYSNYSNLDVGNADINIDTDRHQVVAGLGMRF